MNVLSKNNIKITWKLAYAGLKNGIVTPDEIVDAAFKDEFATPIDEDVLVGLELKRESGKDELLTFLEQTMKDSGISAFTEADMDRAVRTWQLAFLLDIQHAHEQLTQKLQDIEVLWSGFGNPLSWEPFIYFMPVPSGWETGEENVYSRFTDFIKKESSLLLPPE
jgi:hypothetical protein